MGCRKIFVAGAIALGVSLVAGCTTAPAPPPAPKPVYEYRPYPPNGAAPNLAIPPVGADGVRATINRGISGNQAIWNLRSAYNVAALNCSRPEHASLVDGYGSFLNIHKSSLSSANRALDSEFRSRHGSKYIREREGLQTQVYNYFALPPVLPSLCDTMLTVGKELQGLAPGQLETYAATGIPRLEALYLDFFDRYDKYRRDFAQWQIDYQAKYGVPPADGYFLPGEPRVQVQPVAAPAPAAP